MASSPSLTSPPLLLLLLIALLSSSPTPPQTNAAAVEQHATFVFVHGAGFGAWCWFKEVSMLKSRSYGAVAIDLAGAGLDPSDPNTVTTIEEWSKPLMDYVSNFSGPGKLTLVGHSLGGLHISLAMEKFPEKISSGVFLAANMPLDGDNFSSTTPPGKFEESLALRHGVYVFKDPSSSIPTSAFLNRDFVQAALLNRSPKEYVELTLLLTRPTPFRPLFETIHLTQQNYGSIKRFYIKTLQDNAVPMSFQDYNLERNPGARVFKLDSDHSAFFSKPERLRQLLLKTLS